MPTVSNVSPTSSAWVQNLVNLALTAERQPLQRLQAQKDTLKVRRAVYDDISAKISTLQTSIEAMKGFNNVFDKKAVSVKNATEVAIAAVSVNGVSAVAGVYNLHVTKLAKSHQIGSAQQAQSDVALGLSGTFVLGGAVSRSVSGNLGANNPVTAFGAGGTIRANELEVGSAVYSVEFRQNGSDWQFRVVDESGKAVRIDDASDSGTAMTTGWQNYAQVKNSTFDTGRGLTLTFANADPTEQQLFGDADIAKGTYIAQGASIAVAAGDSLNDIRTKINSATFAEGNQVQATVVDRKLVLTGARTGANAAIKLIDSSYSGETNTGVLAGLGIAVNSSGVLTNTAANQLRTVQNAELTLNNIQISRSFNTGLQDLVQGLSFDLTAEGDATITVSESNSAVEEQVKKVLTNVNDLRGFLKEKTEAKPGQKDANGNPTYTPAPLGQDSSMRSLRQDIASDMLQAYNGAIGTAPKYLSQLGIKVNDQGAFELSDPSALTSSLKDNFQGVKSLFNHILGRLETRLDIFIDGSESIVKSKQSGLDDELKQIDGQISQYEKRLKSRETALTQQYTAIQAQLINMAYQFQSTQAAILGGGFNQQF